MKRRLALALVGAGLATALTGGSVAAQPIPADSKPLDQTVKLTVGVVSSVNAAPLYVADAKGYFRAEKIEVSVTNIPTVSAVQPLLATGRLDVAYGLPSPAFFNGLATGQDVRVVSSAGQPRPGMPNSALIVRKNGPVAKLADLRGKTVSVAGGLAGASAWYLSELLKQANLTVNDLRLVSLSSTDGVAALKNGAVQGVMALGPDLFSAIGSGQYVTVGDMYAVLKNGTGGAFLVGSELTKKNRRAGVAFLRAMLKATRNDLQGDWIRNKEIVQILVKATSSPSWVIKQTFPPTFDRNLTIPATPFQSMQTFWREQKLLNYAPALKVNRIVDAELLKSAVGSYR